MTVLLVLALWLAIACFVGLLFSAVVRTARPTSAGVEPEPEPATRVEVPAPRASADERQSSSV